MPTVAVVDVETTGLFPNRHDRIVEVAIVIARPDGEVVREFHTLVNPERDMGPTRIHRLSAADVLDAPTFADIAGHLTEVLDGCTALAGHNIRFDRTFLAAEFERAGSPLPDVPTICTMRLAGGGDLASCCECYGVGFEGTPHSAMCDARAAARLLARLLTDAPCEAREVLRYPPVRWPGRPRTTARLLSREESRARQAEPPTYLKSLLTRAGGSLASDDDSAVVAYTGLLDRALEDRHVDDREGAALVEMAVQWGLAGDRLGAIHRDYLGGLAAAAAADGVVTDAERTDLARVARLLGIEPAGLDRMLSDAAQARSNGPAGTPPAPVGGTSLAGQSVCFTGECSCTYRGEPITRDVAAGLAAGAGLSVAESVTKKLGVLVVADPLSQSGKAKKARQYGVRVLHEPVFWKMIGVDAD